MASPATPKRYKDQNVNDLTTGLIATISEHGQDYDLISQTTAPLNFRDTRDFRNYRADLSHLKDSVLRQIRTTEDDKQRVKLILSYRFLQRYHKANPRSVSDESLILNSYLSQRMDSQLEEGTFAYAHKKAVDAFFEVQMLVVDAIKKINLPPLAVQKQSGYFPSFDRFTTLNKEEKEKQEAAKPNYDAIAKDIASL